MTDLISRQAAIDEIQRFLGYIDQDMIDRIKIGLRKLPTIEPVKHGRWEPVTNGRGGFECSICHSYAPSYQDGVEWLSLYCPYCGAKMDAEEGEEQ